jgi:PDZ domain-containing protein
VVLSVLSPDAPSAAPRRVSVRLASDPEKAGRAILGVAELTSRNQVFSFPLDVRIDSGEIGGPSAGLAFTLGLIDLLTPGELTGGAPVATTGTIDLDGTIGPVGGVVQKTVAVRRAGAKLFLVPSAEYTDARAHAGDGLRVEKVDTLDDALRALATLAGSNALALEPPGRGAAA